MIFKQTVIRPADGKFWLMNNKDGGFRSVGFQFDSVETILNRFDLKIIETGKDKYGDYILVDNKND